MKFTSVYVPSNQSVNFCATTRPADMIKYHHRVGTNMKAFSVTVFIACCCVTAVQASQNLERARQREESADAMGARTLLARAAQSPGDVTSLKEYAEFLDRYGDP